MKKAKSKDITCPRCKQTLSKKQIIVLYARLGAREAVNKLGSKHYSNAGKLGMKTRWSKEYRKAHPRTKPLIDELRLKDIEALREQKRKLLGN